MRSFIVLAMLLAMVPLNVFAWSNPICDNGTIVPVSNFQTDAQYQKYLKDHPGSYEMGSDSVCSPPSTPTSSPTPSPSPTSTITPTPTQVSTSTSTPTATSTATSTPSMTPQPSTPSSTPTVLTPSTSTLTTPTTPLTQTPVNTENSTVVTVSVPQQNTTTFTASDNRVAACIVQGNMTLPEMVSQKQASTMPHVPGNGSWIPARKGDCGPTVAEATSTHTVSALPQTSPTLQPTTVPTMVVVIPESTPVTIPEATPSPMVTVQTISEPPVVEVPAQLPNTGFGNAADEYTP